MIKAVILSSLVLMSATLVQGEKRQDADVVFVHGDIYTGAVLPYMPGAKPPAGQRAEAIAVKDGRILAIGSEDDVKKFRGHKTQVVDLEHKFVMPGFNDAHVHLASGGFEKLNVNLVGSRSLADMQSRIADRVKTAPPGEWIIGEGWDHTKWPGQKLPTRQDLDQVTAGHPAVFVRVDGHIAVANTAALKAAGITQATKPPAGGAIDLGPDGQPSGILREGAQGLVQSKIPAPAPEQRRRALQLALNEAARWGLTSVQDNSSWDDFLAMQDLEHDGQLPVRVSEWLAFRDPVDVLREHRELHTHTDSMLHTGMLKGFMDGSLGSRTAALLQPYSDDPKNSGLPQFDQQTLNELTVHRVQAGFQIGFHAIGDRAVQMALDAFAAADQAIRENDLHQPNSQRPSDDFRFRIEHDQVVTAEQIPRYRQLGVIASIQPNHLLTDMNWAQDRIGPERARHSYPWADFFNNKVMLACGTDFPVEPLTPFRGIYSAVTRKNEAGTKAYYPEQRLSIEQAIACYTTGSAYAEFAEHDKGLLSPGMLADFVVLDRDITKIPAGDILKTAVLKTVVGGRTVYDAGASSTSKE